MQPFSSNNTSDLLLSLSLSLASIGSIVFGFFTGILQCVDDRKEVVIYIIILLL